ncbi:MAG: CDP-diacylglycerol--glycerol-3-phosphate 3-phosphatidyltransferase [Methylophilales bacterium]|jgi:cardiolipin synthase (CMP-forming)|nr:CDP-diacylglycerol--glycerol-3-phosphate 3-phosphatidyltransferase [Methylophilales bacterium]HCK03145.1 CDP-diacylglycerol--glycerol-3-phosphate 3-phosphatidyltransferase [Methylophilaceae bacterium]|tara:strand:- start:2254 stop:2823 length:570 start_codon:yes stop_codon:yes gene_type:complete
MTYNIPNTLTMFRIVLIPCLVLIFYIPENLLSIELQNLVATIVFVIAAITDWLDGYLARKLNQTSTFGAFFDPVADKLIIIASLLILIDLGRLDVLIGLVIIGREFAVSALREWMATVGKPGSIAVAFIGKLKTTFQMIAIPFLLYDHNILFIPIALIGELLIYIAALLTILSMFYYIKEAMKIIRNRH